MPLIKDRRGNFVGTGMEFWIQAVAVFAAPLLAAPHAPLFHGTGTDDLLLLLVAGSALLIGLALLLARGGRAPRAREEADRVRTEER